MRIVFIAALVLVVGFVCHRLLRNSGGSESDVPVVANDWIPDAERNLTVYIGWPLEEPTEWKRANSYDKTRLELINGTVVAPSDVHAHLLVYSNQELLSGRNIFRPLPAGVLPGITRETTPTRTIKFDSVELARGSKACRVTHGRVRSKPDGTKTYATTLKNVGPSPIRIRSFAAYVPDGDAWLLSTVTGKEFSGEQFIAWYAAPADGWIAPGDQAADESNYGGGTGIWAYFGETQDGKRFIATVPLP